MKVHNYKTASGKDLILEYIDSLPVPEAVDGLTVIQKLKYNKLDELVFKRWQGKIYEVYFYRHNRIFYVTIDDTEIYLLHACRKQKNKTELKDSKIVIRRAKELGDRVGKKFI